MPFHGTRIYPLTDVPLSGLSHAEQVVRLSDGGATLIQIREKNLTPQEFFKQAEEASRIARRRGIRLVVNDRVDIALALGVDGVHLGQEDFPPDAARRLMGDHAVIGVSTHNVEQARRACRWPVNYLAIGPIFVTFSKKSPESVVGLDGLRQVRDAIGDFPLVAIGGITHDNAAAVIDAGADAIAVLSTLLRSPNQIAEQTKRLIAAL